MLCNGVGQHFRPERVLERGLVNGFRPRQSVVWGEVLSSRNWLFPKSSQELASLSGTAHNATSLLQLRAMRGLGNAAGFVGRKLGHGFGWAVGGAVRGVGALGSTVTDKVSKHNKEAKASSEASKDAYDWSPTFQAGLKKLGLSGRKWAGLCHRPQEHHRSQ